MREAVSELLRKSIIQQWLSVMNCHHSASFPNLLSQGKFDIDVLTLRCMQQFFKLYIPMIAGYNANSTTGLFIPTPVS